MLGRLFCLVGVHAWSLFFPKSQTKAYFRCRRCPMTLAKYTKNLSR